MAEGRENIGSMLPEKEGERQPWVEVRSGEGQAKQVLSNLAPPCGHLPPRELGNPKVPSVGGGHGCRSVKRVEPGFNEGSHKEGEMLQTHAHSAEKVTWVQWASGDGAGVECGRWSMGGWIFRFSEAGNLNFYCEIPMEMLSRPSKSCPQHQPR